MLVINVFSILYTRSLNQKFEILFNKDRKSEEKVKFHSKIYDDLILFYCTNCKC